MNALGFEHIAGLAKRIEVALVQNVRRNERANQNFFGIGDLHGCGTFYGRGGTVRCYVLQFLSQQARVDGQLLRDIARQLIANDAAGYALDMRQQIIDRLHLALCRFSWKLCTRTLDQVIEIALRVLERLRIRFFAFSAYEQVRIESGFKGQNADVEVFFDQQAQRALRGAGASIVGIEIDDDIFAETSQQFGLQVSKSCS